MPSTNGGESPSSVPPGSSLLALGVGGKSPNQAPDVASSRTWLGGCWWWSIGRELMWPLDIIPTGR